MIVTAATHVREAIDALHAAAARSRDQAIITRIDVEIEVLRKLRQDVMALEQASFDRMQRMDEDA